MRNDIAYQLGVEGCGVECKGMFGEIELVTTGSEASAVMIQCGDWT